MNIKRSAFTMIELIMVIVVLGILAIMALPRMERDLRQEAADNILSAIRYTQHLALMDNVVDSTNTSWHTKFWRFGKAGCSDNGIFYIIASDTNMLGGINQAEAAIDTENGSWFNGLNGQPCESNIDNQVFIDGTKASSNIFLTNKYGIVENDALMFGSCTDSTAGGGNYIGFDYLGRPHRGFAGSIVPDYSTIMKGDCNLTFQFTDTSIPNLIITITEETGYAFIAGQPDS